MNFFSGAVNILKIYLLQQYGFVLFVIFLVLHVFIAIL